MTILTLLILTHSDHFTLVLVGYHAEEEVGLDSQ